jgi:hypothetical protein
MRMLVHVLVTKARVPLADSVGQGEPRFQVKWEGYEKKSDRTWEPEDNLR